MVGALPFLLLMLTHADVGLVYFRPACLSFSLSPSYYFVIVIVFISDVLSAARVMSVGGEGAVLSLKKSDVKHTIPVSAASCCALRYVITSLIPVEISLFPLSLSLSLFLSPTLSCRPNLSQSTM